MVNAGELAFLSFRTRDVDGVSVWANSKIWSGGRSPSGNGIIWGATKGSAANGIIWGAKP